MTNTALSRRLLKLEASGPQEGLAALTWDELEIHLLEVSRAIVAQGSVTQDRREGCERRIAEIEADIIRTAEKQASPEYQAHLEHLRESWWKRTGRDDYVLALTGGFGEYADWDKPRVMERRTALRSHPLVQELMAQAAAG